MDITITLPQPRRLADIRHVAREQVAALDPPATMREALSIYRQYRAGGVIFIRCRFSKD